jgi:hypothetical protein
VFSEPGICTSATTTHDWSHTMKKILFILTLILLFSACISWYLKQQQRGRVGARVQ